MNLIAHPAGTGLPHGLALGKALGDVQNALVGAAAKAQLQAQLLLPEGAIHQNVQLLQQVQFAGGWAKISSAQLLVPLDVHIDRKSVV